MIIEIVEKETDHRTKKAIVQFKIDGKTFYKAGTISHIEENISDYADYLVYCLQSINEDAILGNSRPILLSPLEFEEKENEPTKEEALKQMLEKTRRTIERRIIETNDL